MKATQVREITGWVGTAALYQLSTRVWDGENGIHFDHVIVSTVTPTYGGMPETFVFAADPEGYVMEWMEQPGSYKGGVDPMRALDNFLAWAEESCFPHAWQEF